MQLNIQCLNETSKGYHSTNDDQIQRGDAGYDLYYCGEDVVIEPFHKAMLGLGVACEPLFDNGYYLYARSSISKTPLMMANSVGIIDSGYRGEIKAAVKNFSNEPYTVVKGTKLFQICMYNLKPFNVNIVESINETIRGEGGFGSTNLNASNDSVISSMTIDSPPIPLRRASNCKYDDELRIDIQSLKIPPSPPLCVLNREHGTNTVDSHDSHDSHDIIRTDTNRK